jgi:hypothetical protein
MSEDAPVPVPPAKKQRKAIRNVIPLTKDKTIIVYSGKKLSEALSEISSDMSLYHGVRLSQILEAVHDQAKKDGAREAFEALDRAANVAKGLIPHRNPGQPKKPKKPARRKNRQT